MQGEGAAAARGRGHDDLEAVPGQQPDRRGVDRRRQRLLDAALEQRNAPSAARPRPGGCR